MTLRQRLTTLAPTGKKRTRMMVIGILCTALLLCGFIWTWFIEFTMRVLFPVEDMLDQELVVDFVSIVDPDDMQLYLTEPIIATQIITGLQANLSADVYDNIEIPEMREESLGSYIIRIIFDRLFS